MVKLVKWSLKQLISAALACISLVCI